MVEKGDAYGKRLEGRYLVGDDDKNGQEHGSCTEINKCRVAKHEITVRSSLSVSDARCQLEEVKVQMCVP
jgi:hypothetical protein